MSAAHHCSACGYRPSLPINCAWCGGSACMTPDEPAASAPELLKALERIAYEPQGPSDASADRVLDAVVEIARAAIAKARGGK